MSFDIDGNGTKLVDYFIIISDYVSDVNSPPDTASFLQLSCWVFCHSIPMANGERPTTPRKGAFVRILSVQKIDLDANEYLNTKKNLLNQ